MQAARVIKAAPPAAAPTPMPILAFELRPGDGSGDAVVAGTSVAVPFDVVAAAVVEVDAVVAVLLAAVVDVVDCIAVISRMDHQVSPRRGWQ